MAWQEPKTNWEAPDVVNKDDLNRIENNTKELKDTKAEGLDLENHIDTNATTSQRGHVQLGSGADRASPGNHSHDNATTGAAGFMSAADKTMLNNATNTATASRLILRDTAGRAKVATPSASDDIARKAEVDAKVDKPTSASSGNIAVFDGGAGKVKDGGVALSSLGWVKPGNTVLMEWLQTSEYTEEQFYYFTVGRAGRYRVTGEVARADADNGIFVSVISGGALPTAGNTAVGRVTAAAQLAPPTKTYTAFSIDMLYPVSAGGHLCVTINCYSNASVRNIRIKYAEGGTPENIGP